MKNGTPFQTGNRGGLCFICHSPGHKQASCPTRKISDSRGVDSRVAARIYACAVETPTCDKQTSQLLQPSSQVTDTGDHQRSTCRNTNVERSHVW